MKIYVSGASGLVGSAVVKELQFKGYEVLTKRVDLLSFTGPTILAYYFKSQKIDLVIHCAGRVGGIKANSENNEVFYQENKDMGLCLASAAINAKVPYFINLASTCAYPKVDSETLLTEEMFFNEGKFEETNNGYAKAKQEVADFVRHKYMSRGITLIPCNMYGEGDRYFEGSHVIPDLIQKFHKAKVEGIKELTLYGTGTPLREFIENYDLAEVISYMVDQLNMFGEFPMELLNVGSTEEISIMQLATYVANAVGWQGTIKWSGELNGIMRKKTDVSKLVDRGFEFNLDDIRDNLKDIVYPDYLKRYVNV